MAIGATSSYQNSQNNVTGTKQTNKTEKTKGKYQTKDLSPAAQAYLKELQKKYSNMDFQVVSYETEEEAAEYLSKKTSKEYNVIIDPELLEKMATDSKTREKYEGILSNAGVELTKLKDQAKEEGIDVKSFGITVDKDGVVTYLAEISKSTAKSNADRNESIDQAKEAKKKEAEKAETKRLKASSAEQLMEMIRKEAAESKMMNIKTEEERALGGSIDFRM